MKSIGTAILYTAMCTTCIKHLLQHLCIEISVAYVIKYLAGCFIKYLAGLLEKKVEGLEGRS